MKTDKSQSVKKSKVTFLSRSTIEEWLDEKQQKAWDKMGSTGSDEYMDSLDEENFWFGYYRALEDIENEFFE